MRRKNIHPRYRNKCSLKDEKQLLIKKKQEIKFNKFRVLLYSLPLDMNCRIFQMAMSTHIIKWISEMKPAFLPVISEYLDSKEGLLYIKNDGTLGSFVGTSNITEWVELDTYNIRKNLPCIKNMSKGNQSGIISVYIPPQTVNDFSLIKNRLWSNLEDYYWTHQSCRCYCCDLVRVLSGKNVNFAYSAEATGLGRDYRMKHRKRYINHTYRKITMNQFKPSPWEYNN